MKGITIKLSEATLRRLREEARATGRTVSAIVRERIETPPETRAPSVFDLSADVMGSLAGSRRSATNDRPKFRRR